MMVWNVLLFGGYFTFFSEKNKMVTIFRSCLGRYHGFLNASGEKFAEAFYLPINSIFYSYNKIIYFWSEKKNKSLKNVVYVVYDDFKLKLC